MFTTTSGSIYKQYQDRFIRKNRTYLRRKSAFIEPVDFAVPSKKMEVFHNKEPNSPNSSEEKLEVLADKVSQPLLTMTTLPLLQIFPVTITIDLKKVTINDTTFFLTHSVQTITYENIKEICLETGIISASLKFVLTGQTMHPIIVKHFKIREAVEAKRLILGLMQCQRQQIKTDELDPLKDRERIVTLGTAASP